MVIPSARATSHAAPTSCISSAPWWRRAELLGAMAALVCYVNVLPNDFCDDGGPIVRDNYRVTEPGRWLDVWTTDYWSETALENPNRDLLYRPVALTSYRLVRIVLGDAPLPHHVVNLLLHMLLCGLIARLCRHLGGSELAATVAALLFAALPIHTEVLNNVVGRADLLAAVGLLLAVLAHRRSLSASRLGDVVGWRVAAALAAFVAMGSKESGVGVVLVVPLFDALWSGQGSGTNRRSRWIGAQTVWRLGYLLIPAALYLALRYHALGGQLHQRPNITKTINVLVDAPLWQHVLGVVQLWGMYWAKTIWPSVLSVNYSINAIRLATDPFDRHVLLGAVVGLVLVLVSLLAWRRGHRQVALLVAVLLITYAPTANALVLMQVFLAERIWFLPSIWIAILAGFAASAIKPRPVHFVVGALVLVGMTCRCWIRNSEWRDNGTLYAAAYRDLPDAVGALYLYGQWLTWHDRPELGIELLKGAIERDLGFTDAHRAVGMAHLRFGDDVSALRHLQIADMQVPGHPPTVAGLERLRTSLVAQDAELARLRRDVTSHSADPAAELALVERMQELGLVREALARFREHEHEFGDRADWQAAYAVTLVLLNERDAAIERYETSLKLRPNEPQRAVELAMLLLERREGDDLDRAWRWSTRSLRLAPGAATVLVCHAELSAVRGDIAGAIEDYKKAIAALPRGSDQRRVFEQRARALGMRP